MFDRRDPSFEASDPRAPVLALADEPPTAPNLAGVPDLAGLVEEAGDAPPVG